MSELAAWLLERIAVDEAVARSRRRLRPEFRGRHIEGSGIEPDWLRIDGEDVHVGDAMEPVPPESRALAEAAAKRAIVEAHPVDEYGDCSQCAKHDAYDMRAWFAVEYPCPTLRALASVYADAEGWREEWAQDH